ncbi:hypothetical protein PODOV084v1_p0038 [Vibrio phage 340E47.2]|nr:hypothetical protein PODOV084v1_p0038 [Vibrio phage 340E47.2]QZI91944.1 hypothetical protein PODOV077v1_p0033 [Vibrio phage 5P1a]
MRLETVNQFKSLIGERVFALPTGNNARNNKDSVVIFSVKSCARKYVSLARIWSKDDDSEANAVSYLPQNGATKEAVNSGFVGTAGYEFFSSEESIERYKEISGLRSDLSSRFKELGLFGRLSDDAILELKVFSDKHLEITQ